MASNRAITSFRHEDFPSHGHRPSTPPAPCGTAREGQPCQLESGAFRNAQDEVIMLILMTRSFSIRMSLRYGKLKSAGKARRRGGTPYDALCRRRPAEAHARPRTRISSSVVNATARTTPAAILSRQAAHSSNKTAGPRFTRMASWAGEKSGSRPGGPPPPRPSKSWAQRPAASLFFFPRHPLDEVDQTAKPGRPPTIRKTNTRLLQNHPPALAKPLEVTV